MMRFTKDNIVELFSLLGESPRGTKEFYTNDGRLPYRGMARTDYGDLYFEVPAFEPYRLYIEFDDIMTRSEVFQFLKEQFDRQYVEFWYHLSPDNMPVLIVELL